MISKIKSVSDDILQVKKVAFSIGLSILSGLMVLLLIHNLIFYPHGDALFAVLTVIATCGFLIYRVNHTDNLSGSLRIFLLAMMIVVTYRCSRGGFTHSLDMFYFFPIIAGAMAFGSFRDLSIIACSALVCLLVLFGAEMLFNAGYYQWAQDPPFPESLRFMEIAISMSITIALYALFHWLSTKQKKIINQQRTIIDNQAKLSALGEMAGGIAHEVNNPLAIIVLEIERLRKMIGTHQCTKANIFNSLDLLDRTANRISRIVLGMRLIARDGAEDPKDQVDIYGMIEQVISLFRERFRKANIDLTIYFEGSDLEVFGQRVQLSQVLVNLLNNAYDAALELDERWVKIMVSAERGSIFITVTDSGCGIDEKIADKIMQPFFTTKEVGKGTGIGLSISRGIVEDHGGCLAYDDGHPRTRFIVELPQSIQIDYSHESINGVSC